MWHDDLPIESIGVKDIGTDGILSGVLHNVDSICFVVCTLSTVLHGYQHLS